MTAKTGHLLLVDDENDIVEILRELLTPYTAKITVARDGVEGLQIIRAGEIDALISDIQMPRMNGLQMLAETRRMGLETPFVVLTAYGDRHNFQEAVRLNATDFLEKPFAAKEVIRVASNALALGLALKEFEESLQRLFEHSRLPADEIARAKAVKRTIRAMKLRFCTIKSA